MAGVSALPLLAYKVGPNLFDLSSRLHYVSIRDQSHRAVALAESLVAGKQLHPEDRVLIVGAGVAGVVAGMVLARHGVRVQIVDTSMRAPFALQRGVRTRYVGPYMYEWPLPLHDCQRMPPPEAGVLSPWDQGKTTLPFDSPDPVSPGRLAIKWQRILKQEIAASGGLLRLQVGIDGAATNRQVGAWLEAERHAHERAEPDRVGRPVAIHGGAPWRGSQAPERSFAPRFVLLAAGMGPERNIVGDSGGSLLLDGGEFWANDDIPKHRCGLASAPRVVVIGGGDGGLQDVLRTTTIDDHPLQTWQRLRNADRNGVLPRALADIQVLEAQHALNAIWAAPDALRLRELPILDASYQALAARLAKDPHIARAVRASLRKDVKSVHLCIREAWFSKAYALNRLLVHLFEQSASAARRSRGAVGLTVVRQVQLASVGEMERTRTLTFSDGTALVADIAIVRFGPDPSALPGQWLGLTARDTANRQELAAVPLPLYLPPSR